MAPFKNGRELAAVALGAAVGGTLVATAFLLGQATPAKQKLWFQRWFRKLAWPSDLQTNKKESSNDWAPATDSQERLAPAESAEDFKPDPFNSSKRIGYLSWDDYFMAIAFLSAQRSKDPYRQVGACLVSQDRVILGIGYNGFPSGCSDDQLPWAKISTNGNPLQTKYPYVCHAEVNAILNRNHASAAGQKLYVTMFPCNECTKVIIQAKIAEVVYFQDKGQRMALEPALVASKRMLDMAKVKVWQHRPLATQLLLEYK